MQRRDAIGCMLGAALVRTAHAQAAPPQTLQPPQTPAPAAGPAPAAARWSPDGLAAVDRAAQALGSDAVLVLHRGAAVHAFGDITKPMNLYSARKSVLSILFGIHAARGEIDPGATLATLGIDDKQGLSDTEKTATVRQLLQARSGVYHPAAYETADMAANRPLRGSHAPGSFWYYNNWDFNALATIFRSSTGSDVFQALETDLAVPLGFEDFRRAEHTRWHLEPASVHPAYLMFLSARDLGRIGLLMLQGGRWGALQIVPPAWVAESTAPVSDAWMRWHAYGHLWWVPLRAWPFWTRRPGDVFFASGNHGQLLLVDRARDVVVVHRIDGARWFARNPELSALSPLLAAVLAAMPAAA